MYFTVLFDEKVPQNKKVMVHRNLSANASLAGAVISPLAPADLQGKTVTVYEAKSEEKAQIIRVMMESVKDCQLIILSDKEVRQLFF